MKGGLRFEINDELGEVASTRRLSARCLPAGLPRKTAGKYGTKGGLRAIQVKVAFGLSEKQGKYLEFWSRRSKYAPTMVRKLGPRVFELPPNALSLYLLARLRQAIGSAFLHAYPVGFSSDIPQVPKRVAKLFVKKRLWREQAERLEGISLRSY